MPNSRPVALSAVRLAPVMAVLTTLPKCTEGVPVLYGVWEPSGFRLCSDVRLPALRLLSEWTLIWIKKRWPERWVVPGSSIQKL